MAQIASGTSGIANLDVNALQTLINTVRARLVADKTIRAQDMRDIVNVYNTLIQHNHSVTDNYYVAFGNKAPRGSYSEGRFSEIPGKPAYLPFPDPAIWEGAGTFYYTVPNGVYAIDVLVIGAGGGGSTYVVGPNSWWYGGQGGGAGGASRRTIAVTPGQVLTIVVGQGGQGGDYYGFYYWPAYEYGLDGSYSMVRGAGFADIIANGGKGAVITAGYVALGGWGETATGRSGAVNTSYSWNGMAGGNSYYTDLGGGPTGGAENGEYEGYPGIRGGGGSGASAYGDLLAGSGGNGYVKLAPIINDASFQAFNGSGIVSGGSIVTNAIRDLVSLVNLFKSHGHSIIDNTY